MKTLRILFTVTITCLLFAADADAQRGGRGGERGGGERGGGERGGGERGGRGGGGERGGAGGERGGRPSFGGGAEGGGERGGRGGGGERGGAGGERGGRPSFGGGAEGGGRGDMMGRLDRDGNGRIEQSEIDAIPSFMRESMKNRGIEFKPGSVEELRESMQSQFNRVREEGNWGRPSTDRTGGDPNGAGNRQKYAPAASFRPRTKERLTTDLPESYLTVDANADGQVALHEWILTRRSEMSLFEQIDGDADGILTPVELVAFENEKDDEEEAEKWVRDRLVIVGSSGSSGGRGSASRSDRKDDKRESKDDKQKHEQFASYAFRTMDKNKNGKMDPEEWAGSRRVRPMFEKAGVKLTAMDADEFQKRYVKAAMSGK